MSQNAQIPTYDGNGQFPAYIARPDGAPAAAIIVVPEIFGVNPGIRMKCDHWANLGYLAVAPDIFWRFAAGEELNPDIEEQFQLALTNMGKFDADLCVQDIEALIHWLKETQGVNKVGLTGFCLGGRMAYLAATRTDIDASVGYYGVMIDQMLEESHAIANPLMLHIAKNDHFVGPEAQAAIHAGLDPNPHVTLYDYEGVDHGFASSEGKRRDETAARLADERTEAFFRSQLG
ncbi:MAG: dienelactone hydrolase family protein [Sphingomonadaceae bacterium]